MSTAAVLAPTPVELAPIVDAVTVDGTTSTTPIDDVLSVHAAVLKAAEDGDKVDKDALAKLLTAIGEQTKDVVSLDLVLAHLVLLATFHQQLREADEAKDLAYLCSAETRYFAFTEALGKAIAKDASLIQNPPLPPLDVAMFWHSHMLSPVRYADDVQRLFSPDMAHVEFPMMRLSKTITGTNQEDLDAGRAFWAAHMPADMPYDLAVADVDETAVKGKIACVSCRAEHTLAMPEYAAFRLHGKEHTCTSCAVSFTAEHLAVRRFLAKVARAPRPGMIAGTLQHPKTLEFAPKNGANMADLTKLFYKTTWKQHVAALPALPTWADVENKILAPIMAATADLLILPGNRRRFALVVNAHRDVTTGSWSMDLVRAVRRQRRFSQKMTDCVVRAGCGAIHATVIEALVQYPKFLAIMAIRPKCALVPTTTIDLAWHTHQLTPSAYAEHTRALTGQIANHDDADDVESKAAIAESAKAMPDAWRAVFDEDYYRPNVHGQCSRCDRYSCAQTTMKDAGSANAGCVRSGCLSPCASRCAGWTVAAGATKSAACYFTGDCIDGKAKLAACYFTGDCIDGKAKSAARYFTGDCIDGKTKSAAYYDSGDCVNNPVFLADGKAE